VAVFFLSKEATMERQRREFLHHEHCLCHPRIVVGTNGKVSLTCSTHSPDEKVSGQVTAARLCLSDSGTYGNLLLNASLPSCPHTQAIKLSGGRTIPRQVRRIDTTGVELLRQSADGESSGYYQEACPNCPDLPGYMFAEQYAVISAGKTTTLQVLLRCRGCDSGRLLQLPAVQDLRIGRCKHNSSHRTAPAPALYPW